LSLAGLLSPVRMFGHGFGYYSNAKEPAPPPILKVRIDLKQQKR
jgi:hypothetical protein